jgi:DNA-binding MarR family transcriptional regulator
MEPLISLPTEERILLYLSDFKGLDNLYVAPPDVTQKEIAIGVRVQRKHISRYLKKLMEKELVEEKVCHVQGAKQRMKCYELTWKGFAKAKEIRKFVGNKKVKVLIGGEEREMLVSEIDGATSVHLTLSDIVGDAIDARDHLDMEHLEQIEERKRRTVDERTRKAEVYRRALVMAWRSGVLTSSEQHLICALREHLGVSEEMHNTMEAKIIADIDPIRTELLEVYTDVLMMIGEKPTEREERILELLKERFNVEK